MRIGFSIPQYGAVPGHPDEIAEFARQIEALGGDSLWVGDRVLAPVNPTVGYAHLDHFPESFRSILDPFALLTVAATATERVQIGTNVVNTPWYAPVLLARSLTTIDVLSRGRLVVGMGTGWSPEEFEAVGIPMKERGARTEESLDALEALWTTAPSEYHGKYWTVPATHADLKPVRRPRPPIYLAAYAPPTMRRVARRADGFLPGILPGAGVDALTDIDTNITRPWAQIREMAEQEGRDPAAIGAILRVYPTAAAGPQETAEAILRAGEVGIDHVLVDLHWITSSYDRALELAARTLELARKG